MQRLAPPIRRFLIWNASLKWTTFYGPLLGVAYACLLSSIYLSPAYVGLLIGVSFASITVWATSLILRYVWIPIRSVFNSLEVLPDVCDSLVFLELDHKQDASALWYWEGQSVAAMAYRTGYSITCHIWVDDLPDSYLNYRVLQLSQIDEIQFDGTWAGFAAVREELEDLVSQCLTIS